MFVAASSQLATRMGRQERKKAAEPGKQVSACPCSHSARTARWQPCSSLQRCSWQVNLSNPWLSARRQQARETSESQQNDCPCLVAGLALGQGPPPGPEQQSCPGNATYTAAACPNMSCYASQPNGCGSRSVSAISDTIVPDRWPAGEAARNEAAAAVWCRLAVPAPLPHAVARCPYSPICRRRFHQRLQPARPLLPHPGDQQGRVRPSLPGCPADRVPHLPAVRLGGGAATVGGSGVKGAASVLTGRHSVL